VPLGHDRIDDRGLQRRGLRSRQAARAGLRGEIVQVNVLGEEGLVASLLAAAACAALRASTSGLLLQRSARWRC
jgi:hypothetical protein